MVTRRWARARSDGEFACCCPIEYPEQCTVYPAKDMGRNTIGIVFPLDREVYGCCLLLAGDQDDHMSGGSDQRWSKGNADGPQLRYRIGDDETLGLMERSRARKKRGDVGVRAHTEQYQVELGDFVLAAAEDAPQRAFVGSRCFLWPKFSGDTVNAIGVYGQLSEKRFGSEAIVAVRMFRGHGAFVAPEPFDRVPVHSVTVGWLGQQLVQEPWCAAAR